jgi:hypothetical protein
LRPLALRLAKGLQLAWIHYAVAVDVHALESVMQKLILLLGRQIRSGKALGDKGLRALHLLELLRLVLIEAKPRALEPDPLASNRCER